MLQSLLMGRQKRPAGVMYSVDEAWKRDVLVRMDAKGISKAELARLVGVTPGAITILFQPKTQQSRLVPKIHKVLEFAATTGATLAIERDDLFKRLTRAWAKLDDAAREQVSSISELLASKR